MLKRSRSRARDPHESRPCANTNLTNCQGGRWAPGGEANTERRGTVGGEHPNGKHPNGKSFIACSAVGKFLSPSAWRSARRRWCHAWRRSATRVSTISSIASTCRSRVGSVVRTRVRTAWGRVGPASCLHAAQPLMIGDDRRQAGADLPQAHDGGCGKSAVPLDGEQHEELPEGKEDRGCHNLAQSRRCAAHELEAVRELSRRCCRAEEERKCLR